MRVLISYDIDIKHVDVKQELKNLKFKDVWETKEEEIHNLPATTLYHSNLEGGPEKAKTEFFRIIGELDGRDNSVQKIHVSHFIAIEMGSLVSGIKGDPHT